MELWIRNQDRTMLIKVSSVLINSGNYRIYTNELIGTTQLTYVLGDYKTKERALEVLDEIQYILKPKYILDSSSIKSDGDNWVENGIILQKYNAIARIEELSTYVYEMPEE